MLIESRYVAHMLSGLSGINQDEALGGIQVLLMMRYEEMLAQIASCEDTPSFEKSQERYYWDERFVQAMETALKILS